MKKRIYIAGGDPAILSYNSKELSFNGDTLTFWIKGLTHFDVNSFIFSDAEMGDSTITLDMLLPTSQTPEFDRFWYVDFRGERFYLSTLKPTCVKDTESLQYKYSLIFKSQRSDLERFEFANFVTVTDSIQQVVSYDFTLPITIQEFVQRMNINLEYYFGSGVWQMALDASYMSNINTIIYDGTSRVTVAFSRQSLWSVLTGIYETFGVRWKISNESGIMTIRLGYNPVTLAHTFQYGKDNGLISIERVNPQTPVFTRLSGRGSTRNLPYRYFDSATSEFIADPDNNQYTQDIPYSALMTASYREYVKGWNDKTADNPPDSSTYAYELGYNDAAQGRNFNPVDYVISESAEEIYGIRKGSVADNEDIYPTFSEAVLAVEQVLNDDYNSTDAELNQIVADAVSYCNYQGDRTFNNSWVIQTEQFETLADFDNVSFNLTLDVSSNASSNFIFRHTCLVELLDADSSVVDSSTFSITDSSTYLTSRVVKFEDLDPSTYTIRIASTFLQNSGRQVYCTQTASSVTRHPKNQYKDTFDIWIGNVWNTTYRDVGHPDETPEQYMHRVWDGLISPSGDITVMFRDGALAGSDYEFKIAKPEGTEDYFIYYDTSVAASHWRLSLLKSDANIESSKLPLPNTFQNASAGDNYFFINIEMPYHPYVYDAEQRLEEFLQNELLKVNNENPTYAITPSSVFLETYSENASIATGAQIKISDPKMVGSGYITLSITNLTIEYTADAILPKWNVTVAEKPTSQKSSIQVIQGDLKVLSSNLLSAQELTEQVQLALDNRYLQKSGIEQTSYSKTTFKDTLKVGANFQSEEYLQGQVGGYGFSIFKDTTGSYVMEIDKLNVRKALNINELVVNQVSIYGGIHVYSAAAMTVSSVDNSAPDYSVCYLDIKNGTVLNQFVSGDHAYCQRFEPETGQLLKYYWKEVIEVGSDFIVISKTGGDGSVNTLPSVGDNIAQLGNNSDAKRQSALIIDQTNGGTVTQYAAINNFSLTGKDYIRYGVDPSTGRAYEYIYGNMYVGGRKPAVDNYLQFDSSTGRLRFRGVITQDSVIDDGGGGTPPTVDRGLYDPDTQYFAGNTVYYQGSTYYCFITPPIGTPPTNTKYWRLHAQGGVDSKLVSLYATSQIIKQDDAGVRTPTSITVEGVVQNTVISIWEYSVDGGIFTTTPPTGVVRVGNVVTITSATITFSILTIRISDGMYSDTMTFARMDNNSGYTIIMSNEAHVLPANTDGTVKSYVGSGNKVSVYKGVTKLTPTFDTPSDWTNVYKFSRIVTEGSIDSPGADIIDNEIIIYDYSNMVGDLVTIDHIFNIENEVNVTRTQTLTKSRDGSTGKSGGNSAVLFFYKRSATTPSWDGTYGFTYNFISKTIIEGSTGTWSMTLPTSGTNPIWVITGIAYSITPEADIFASELSSPSLLSKNGDDAISIYCENQNLSVEPNINAFTKTVKFKLLSGGTVVSTSQYTRGFDLVGLVAGSYDVGTDEFSINLTGFENTTTGVGYINVSVAYGGNTYQLSVSVVRLATPVMINGKEWVSGTSYTGNYIQRSVVKYLTGWYAARPSAGTFTSTTAPNIDTTKWEALNSFTNVATDSLFAANANIAGFIYKNEQMVSQSGTIAGDASTNWANNDFLPNLLLDGKTGSISARSAEISGNINAQSGKIGGLTISGDALISESMSFAEETVESLTTLSTPVTYSIAFQSSWSDNVTGNENAHGYTQDISTGVDSILKFRAAITPDAAMNDRGWKVYILDSGLNIVYQSSGGGSLSATLFQVPIKAGVYSIHAVTVGTPNIGERYINIAELSGEVAAPTTIYAYGFMFKTKIGNNGLFSFWADDDYMYFNSPGEFSVRKGNYGMRITSSGIQKWNGTAWVNIDYNNW